MEFDLLGLHDEVDVLAGGQVEVGDGRGGDVGGQSGAAVGLVGAPDPDGGAVNVHLGDGHGNDVAGAGVWRVEVDGDRRGPKQRDRRAPDRRRRCPKCLRPRRFRMVPVR